MRLTVIHIEEGKEHDPQFFDVAEDTEVATLKSIIELETGVPILRQQLTVGGEPSQHADDQTVKDLGLAEDDILLVQDRQTTPLARGGGPAEGGFSGLGGGPAGSGGVDGTQPSLLPGVQQATRQAAEMLLAEVTRNPGVVEVVRQRSPALAAAMEARNTSLIQQHLASGWPAISSLFSNIPGGPVPGGIASSGRREGGPPPNFDVLSTEGQQYLLEQIRQQRVNENLQTAQEYLPESFGQVCMLYVPVEVNQNPLIAFVDSGAQATIMSLKCARRCNLESLIDKRFTGVAQGVGRANVVGRVHMAQIKVGTAFIAVSFLILEENSIDLLFGLDLLRRHHCQIDLKGNCLRIGDDVAVQFLSEGEIKAHVEASLLIQPALIHHGNNAHDDAHDDAHAAQATRLMVETRAERKRESRLEATAEREPMTEPEKVTRAPSFRERPSPADHPLIARAASPQNQLTPTRTAGGHGAREIEAEKVRALVHLGLEEGRAREALIRANGNADVAAAELFASMTDLPK